MSAHVTILVKHLFGVEFMPIPMRTPAEVTFFVRVNNLPVQEITVYGMWGNSNECPDKRWSQTIPFPDVDDIYMVAIDTVCNGACDYATVVGLVADEY